MATEQEDKVATLGDTKGVVNISVAEGGSFFSDKKFTLFDDEFRFMKDGNKTPAYYFKNSVAQQFVELNQEYKDNLSIAEAKISWWENYYSHTEDEIRAAMGRFWRRAWKSNSWNYPTDARLYSKTPDGHRAAPPFSDHGPNNVSGLTDWILKPVDGVDSSVNNVPWRQETITFQDCFECTPSNIISFAEDASTPELVTLAANVAEREHYQGEEFPPAGGSKKHVDYTTTYFQAISHKEVEDKGVINRPLYYKAESDYNFYIKSYENYLSEKMHNQRIVLLPNINVMLLEEMTRDDDEKTNFHDFITLGGKIKKAFTDVMNEKGEKIKEVSNGQYFEKWRHAYGRMNETKKLALLGQYKDILMPYELNKKVAEYQHKRFMFPMFFDLEFATDTNCKLADLLDEFGLDGPLLKTIVEGSREEFGNGMKDKLDFRTTQGAKRDHFWIHNDKVKTEEKLKNRNSFKFFDDTGKNWIHQYGSKGPEIFFRPNSDSFAALAPQDSDYYKTLHKGKSNEGKIINKLLFAIFKGKFYKLLKEKTRSFKTILQGKKAYSEVVAYKIEKYYVHKPDEEDQELRHVQNYYYTNTSKLDILKHVDTQMKYNKTYHYRVYSWLAIFGTQYEYKVHNKHLPSSYGGKAPVSWIARMRSNINILRQLDVNIESQPIVKMVEVPYFSTTTRIVDTPPLAPNVNMIPYKNNRNKFLINLTSQTGEAEEPPILIDSAPDHDNFLECYQAQERAPSDSDTNTYMPLFFQSDDPTQIFQIFRINRPPESYSDFAGTKKEYNTATLPKYTAASSFSIVDTISPNTKYYYTFRSVDIHGHISNPSPVYKVEIVDNGGAVYFLVELFNFKDYAPKPMTRKNMKRFISLLPAVEQKILNAEESGLEFDDLGAGQDTVVNKNPVLGTAEVSIYNATNPRQFFKVRLISKSTGRKIDFNLAFEYDHKNPNVKQISDIKDSDSATTPN